LEESKQKDDGTKTELDFIFLLQKYQIDYQKSSLQDDYYHHYDIELFFQNKSCKIDVKGMKSLRRNGLKQNKYFFVELNVEGWLFGGKADFIAVEMYTQQFLIFDKKKLQQYVLKTVDFTKPIVAWPEQSLNRVYIRYPKPNMKHCSVLSLLDTIQAYLMCGVGKFS
jgi:hypothetical protein